MRLIFYGTPDYTAEYLDQLHAAHSIAAVVTAPDRSAGRGRHNHRPAPALWAEAHGIPCFQPDTLRDPGLIEEIRSVNADLGTVVAYGKLLPESLYASTPHGYINLHFSLLPAFRGASPIESALLCGMETTGVSVQRITEELDAGDLLLSEAVTVAPEDHFPELFQKLHRTGCRLLPQAVEKIAQGTASWTPQDEQGIIHCGKISNSDRNADWHQPAAELLNRIRAYSGHRTVRASCRGEEILLHRAAAAEGAGLPGTVLQADKKGLVVACGHGAIQLLLLQRQNRKPMEYTAFLNGFRLLPGESFSTAQDETAR